jgi:hypothetical protein
LVKNPCGEKILNRRGRGEEDEPQRTQSTRRKKKIRILCVLRALRGFLFFQKVTAPQAVTKLS